MRCHLLTVYRCIFVNLSETPDQKGQKSAFLSGKKLQAAQALADGATIKRAAQSTGIAERTLKNWLHEADFRDALNTMQEDAINTAARYLASVTRGAAAVLVEIMLSKEYDPANNIRLKAAQAILDTALRYAETTTFKDELDKLKEALGIESTE